MMSNAMIDQWMKELWHPENDGDSLFAIVDGCKTGDFLASLVNNDQICCPLTTCSGNEEFYKTLPWLVEINPEEDLLSELLENYGKGWGIFIRSEAKFEEIAEHFAPLSTALLPNGRSTWLRYYEPCFFRSLVRYSGEDNLQRLYGDKIKIFYAENPRETILESFLAPDHDKLTVKAKKYLSLSPEILERLDEARMDEIKRILGIRYMCDTPQSLLTAEKREQIELDLGDLVERASGYGINDLKSLNILADAARFWGLRFDEEKPEAREILTDTGIQGWARALFVKQLLRESTGADNEYSQRIV